MATRRKPVPEVRAERRTELTNAVCPKCDGPLYFSEARWLFCANCHATKLGTGNAPVGDVTRANLDAVNRWIVAGRALVEASKRDSEACRLLRTAPPEWVKELTSARARTRRACERAARRASRLRVAAFGESPL